MLSLFDVNALLYLLFLLLSFNKDKRASIEQLINNSPSKSIATLFFMLFFLVLIVLIFQACYSFPTMMFILLSFAIADLIAKRYDL